MSNESRGSSGPAPKPTRPQFTLRTMFLVVTLTAIALGLLRGLLLWGGAAGGVIFVMLLTFIGLNVAILTGSKRWVIVLLLLLLLFVLLISLPPMVRLSFPAIFSSGQVGEPCTR